MVTVNSLKNLFSVEKTKDAMLLTFLFSTQKTLDFILASTDMAKVEDNCGVSDTIFNKELCDCNSNYLSLYIELFNRVYSQFGNNKEEMDLLFKTLVTRTADDFEKPISSLPLMKFFRKTEEVKLIHHVFLTIAYHRVVDKDLDPMVDIFKQLKERFRDKPKNYVLDVMQSALSCNKANERRVLLEVLKVNSKSADNVENYSSAFLNEMLEKIKMYEQEEGEYSELLERGKVLLNKSIFDIESKDRQLKLNEEKILKLEKQNKDKDTEISGFKELLALTENYENSEVEVIYEEDTQRNIVGCKSLLVIGGVASFGKKIREFIFKHNLDIKYIDNVSRLTKEENRIIVFNAYGSPHHLFFKVKSMYKDRNINIITAKDISFVKEYLIYE